MERSEPEVTGTVDMTRPFTATPNESFPVASVLFGEVLRRVSSMAPVQVSIERADAETSDWVVTRLGGSAPEGEVLFSMPSKVVRNLLAYVAFAAMRGQVHGGYMHRLVHVDGTPLRGIFYLSNDGFAGFWLRLYLFKLQD